MRSRIREVQFIKAFTQDVKHLNRKHYDMHKLRLAVQAIVDRDDDALATRYRDHALTGNWAGYRELHIEADWLLVYFIDGDELVLVLTRTGSHDDLFSSRQSARAISNYKTAPRQS